MQRALQAKTVIITGAGKGLGRAYALYMAGLGANMVVNNRRHRGETESSADRVVDEIRASGGRAVAEYSNVEDPATGESLLAAALESFGALDGFIANAGISEGRSFHKQGPDDFRRMIDINLVGTANSLHPAFCHLYEQRHGSIIVSTSAAGLYGEHGLPAYSASKAALLGLTLSLSKEGKSHGVRVNALAPYASTQMTEANLPPALHQRLRPERVAPAVAWLLSDACEVNGEIILVGGGRMSRAGVRESATVLLPENPESGPTTFDQAWQKLKNCPLDEEYHGALEHFAGFIGQD